MVFRGNVQKVIGLGAGGHSKVVIETLQLMGSFEVMGLLDPREEIWGHSLLGVSVLGDDDMLPELRRQGIRLAFIGLGGADDTGPRRRLYEQARAFVSSEDLRAAMERAGVADQPDIFFLDNA